MTRVVNGIYDDVELETGFFVTDKETDILCSWLGCYAEALEKSFQRANPSADAKAARAAKHNKVRSFIRAVERKRKGEENTPKSTSGKS